MKHLVQSSFFSFAFFLVSLAIAADISSLNWDKAEQIAPGISYVHAKIDTPRLMEIHAARVDLKQKNLGFYTTTKADIWGQPMPDCPRFNAVTKRQTCRNFMKQARQEKGLNMVLAVNASPWSPWETPFTHKYAANQGLLVAQGDILEANDFNRPAFVILKNGEYTFHTTEHKVPINDIYISIPAFEYILDKGAIPEKTQAKKDLAPRTGYGLSPQKDMLYLVVIDGRQPNFSMGATIGEVAQILRQYGADCGLNMDGGGSSSMVIWDKDNKHLPKDKRNSVDKAFFLNHQPGGGERNNGNNFGIYLK